MKIEPGTGAATRLGIAKCQSQDIVDQSSGSVIYNKSARAFVHPFSGLRLPVRLTSHRLVLCMLGSGSRVANQLIAAQVGNQSYD